MAVSGKLVQVARPTTEYSLTEGRWEIDSDWSRRDVREIKQIGHWPSLLQKVC